MLGDESLVRLVDAFTQGGTPLPALVGNKMEWQVTVLTAAMLANESLAASMTAEEMAAKQDVVKEAWIAIDTQPE